MIRIADSLVSSSGRPARLRARTDLVARRHHYLGRAYWVIKDPIAQRYFRFHEQEYFLWQQLDGQTSLDRIKARFERRFPPQKITLAELSQFVGMLHESCLVVSDAPGQADRLRERAREKIRRERIGNLSNVLSVRFNAFDPDLLLTWLHRFTGWLFRLPAVVACLLLAVAAMSLVIVQFDTFQSKLPQFQQFFAAENWLLLAVTLAATKVLHEFGHALACKHLGGECHEMGVMLLVLTPCLYCNVSDSWMLPNRFHRAAIGAAGMFVEITLASICTFLWWFSQPGLLHYVCLNVMFVSSVSTVLFNANPLLRYDGYYILSDLMEIPNLRQKASDILRRKLGAWLLGLEEPHDPFLPERRQTFFALFTVASGVYRWVITLSILWFLNRVFEPYGLQIVGQLIAMAALYGLVVAPLWQLGKFLHVPGRLETVKKHRAAYCAAGAGLVLAAIVYVPLPYYLVCDFQIQPRDAGSVYVDVPGRLDEIHVEPGQSVKAGQPLVTLTNLDAETSLARVVEQREQLASRLVGLRHQAFRDESAALQIGQVEQLLSAIDRQLEKRRRSMNRLCLVAPNDGTVLPAPAIGADDSNERLGQWSGTPLEQKNLGAFLAGGVPVCRVGTPGKLEAMITVDQADVEMLRSGRKAELYLAQLPGRRFVSSIEHISKLDAENPKRQSDPNAPDQSDGATSTLGATYRANAPLDDTDGVILIGTTGRAKIHAGYQTLAARVWRYLARTFNFS